MEEIWKPVVGYEGLYEVSSLGNVRSLFRFKKQLKPNRGGNCPYYSVELFKDKKGKRCTVHRIVAKAFIPNPDSLPVVNHKDEDKLNNCADNLEWVTTRYNLTYGTAPARRIAHTDYSKPIFKETARKNGAKVSRAVSQYSKAGELIGRFPSGKSASIETKINHSHIMDCCANKRKSAGGYVWRYEKEERNDDLSESQ